MAWHLYVSEESGERFISKRARYDGFTDLGTPIKSDVQRSVVFSGNVWYRYLGRDRIEGNGRVYDPWSLPRPIKDLYASYGLIELY